MFYLSSVVFQIIIKIVYSNATIYFCVFFFRSEGCRREGVKGWRHGWVYWAENAYRVAVAEVRSFRLKELQRTSRVSNKKSLANLLYAISLFNHLIVFLNNFFLLYIEREFRFLANSGF